MQAAATCVRELTQIEVEETLRSKQMEDAYDVDD